MAHIGLIMTGLTGNLNSSLEVASRLKSEGHKITYLAVRDVKDKIERHGISYVQLPEINFSFSQQSVSLIKNASWLKKCSYHLKNRTKIFNESSKILNLSSYERIIAKLKIDKALIDKELHDLIFVCFKLRIPVTILSTWFSNKMGTGTRLPPLRTDIMPNKGLKGSPLGIFANWMFIKLKVQARILLDKLTFNGYRRTALLKYAKEGGFPTDTLISTNLPMFFSYTNLPFISFSMAEMDFPHQPEKNFIYAGPMVYEKRGAKSDSHKDDMIKGILKSKEQNQQKLIYCAASSLLSPELFFIRNVIEAVEAQDDWILILSLGGKLSTDAFEIKSKYIHIFSWVPQMKVLKYADCCITHAGNNSVNECIHYAVPMLAYSGKKYDQNGCAARIQYHGLGIRGDKDKDDHIMIRQNIKRILDNPYYSERINFFHNKYQEYRQRKLSPWLN